MIIIIIITTRGELRGRAQEWNLSLKEPEELKRLGGLDDLDGAVALSSRQRIARSPQEDTLVASHFKAVRYFIIIKAQKSNEPKPLLLLSFILYYY